MNTLWGLVYPSVLDDFAASFIQYDTNGVLLPRGPNAGGYSYIMTGCPATSLITSAYQRGITKKWNPTIGYNAMKRNHAKGGMLALDMDKELDFYIKKWILSRSGRLNYPMGLRRLGFSRNGIKNEKAE